MSSREKFEQAIKTRFGDLIDYRVCKNSDGEYMTWDMQVAWWAWQAAETDMAVQLANAESKCRELAVESAGLKVKGREVLKEAAYVYSHYNRMVDHLDGESIDGQTLHEFQAVIEAETPATDTFLAEVRASELDSLAGVAETMLVKFSNQRCSSDMHEVVGWKMVLQQVSNRAAQLRKGVAL